MDDTLSEILGVSSRVATSLDLDLAFGAVDVSDDLACTSLLSPLSPLPPSLSLRDFFLTQIEGFVLLIQGLPLSSDFWNGVHSVDESVISPRTRDVDLFKSIARVFLDSPSLPPCS